RARDADLLVEAALDRYHRVDIVVANAGVWEGAPIASMPESLWDESLEVNLKGTWAVCRAAAKQLQQRKGSSIVVVSSTAGQRGESGYSNYAAAKGGQISFTKSLAVELAPEVRVNCVAPGWVDTELNDAVFDPSRGGDQEYKRAVANAIPLRRLAAADD